MFAVYDGHGGDLCCNFLKETFHSYLLEDFEPDNYIEHLKQSCIKLDDDFCTKVNEEMPGNTSGSCALALILVGKTTNDSR
jgi:serine/threonine protein phosphatase PrpC